jgi:hypothetical protein
MSDDPEDFEGEGEQPEDEEVLIFSIPAPDHTEELSIRAEALRIAVESTDAEEHEELTKEKYNDRTYLVLNRAELFDSFLRSKVENKLTLEDAVKTVFMHPDHGHSFPIGNGNTLTIPAIGQPNVGDAKLDPADIDQLVKNAFANLDVQAEEPEYPVSGDAKHTHVPVHEGPFEGPDGVPRHQVEVPMIAWQEEWHKNGWNDGVRRALEVISMFDVADIPQQQLLEALTDLLEN